MVNLDGVPVRVATEERYGPSAGSAGRGNAEAQIRAVGGLMGVRKFRSVTDMPGPPTGRRLDPENIRQALGLSAVAHALRPARLRQGVTKYRSWNDALRARLERSNRA